MKVIDYKVIWLEQRPAQALTQLAERDQQIYPREGGHIWTRALRMTGLGGGVRKGQVGKKFQESSFVSSPVLSRKFSYGISDVHNVYPRDLERENVLGLAWVRRQGDQVLRPPSSCRQATWTVRPPTKALQHRTWSGQEVRAGRPGKRKNLQTRLASDRMPKSCRNQKWSLSRTLIFYMFWKD